MMRNSIKHEKLVRKNDMKWHPWKHHVPHGCFFGLNLRLVWPAPATPLLLGLWPRGLLQRTTIGTVWKHVRGRCQLHLPMTEALVTIERKMPGSGVSLKHFGMKASQQKQYITSNQQMQLHATPSCILRSEVHGTAELWMAHTTPGCIGSPVHQRCWSVSCHLVVSWGLWNLETCQRDCVFSTRIWALPTKSFWILLSWIDIWQSGEIDAMTPCLFVLGPRCSPRWRTQVAIILLTILNDDVMIMGILYPGRLEVCCAENCLSYRDRRLKKMNVFNTWTWTLQNDNNDSVLNFMPKRLKDLGFPAKSDSTKCWHVVGSFDLKFPLNWLAISLSNKPEHCPHCILSRIYLSHL